MSRLVTWSDQFKKDYKLAIKRNHSIEKLDNVIKLLAEGETLPPIYKDHNLAGFWKGFRECHVEPDWLLIISPIRRQTNTGVIKNWHT
jgi:mRNA interferase YafQ